MFAYNATFDKRHLSEFQNLSWYDIMKIAAYKQYNHKIPDDIEICKTGRIKKKYGVETVMNILTNSCYLETHNALQDAIDELKIMQLMGCEISIYENAKL